MLKRLSHIVCALGCLLIAAVGAMLAFAFNFAAEMAALDTRAPDTADVLVTVGGLAAAMAGVLGAGVFLARSLRH